jgi:cysteine desulfurase
MLEPLYFDHAATTQVDAQVIEAMREIWLQGLANPASQHQAGRKARRLLEQTREECTHLLGGSTTGMQADRFLFTSGGTEANQLALLGGAGAAGGRILISAIEHPSVRGAGEELSRRGYRVETLSVNDSGLVDVAQLEQSLAIDPPPQLVSVMLVNNETGVVQPLQEIAQRCRERGVWFHADIVQGVGKLPFDFRDWGIDAVTIAPHKFHGPVGIGGLLTTAKFPVEPLFHGGFQQGGLRPGTENVALAVGFATALRIAQHSLADTTRHVEQLRATFETELKATCGPVVINSSTAPRAAHISNVAFPGIDRQQLFLALDMAGIACSTGSACASGSSEPSPVLMAMGLEKELISSSLRFSFGRHTTLAEVREGVNRISKCINQLRR